MLVRDGLRIVSYEPVPMAEAWWWRPKGADQMRRRAPRVYAILTVVDEHGNEWRYLLVHFPPGGPAGGVVRVGGRNKTAWTESATHASGFDGIVIGDLNGTRAEIRAHVAGPDAAIGSLGKVDHCVTPGDLEVAAEEVPRLGPGHGWGIYTITTKETR